MNPLVTFYLNIAEREAVKNYLIESLKEMTVEKAFAGKSTVGIAEARMMVDEMFSKLDALYGKRNEPIISNSR